MCGEVDVNCIIAPTIELPRREVSRRASCLIGGMPHALQQYLPKHAQQIWDVTFIMDLTICDGMDPGLVLFPRRPELHHVIIM